ncbi:hypothetical protein SCA6_018169 [Theobroma cacao]
MRPICSKAESLYEIDQMTLVMVINKYVNQCNFLYTACKIVVGPWFKFFIFNKLH